MSPFYLRLGIDNGHAPACACAARYRLGTKKRPPQRVTYLRTGVRLVR